MKKILIITIFAILLAMPFALADKKITSGRYINGELVELEDGDMATVFTNPQTNVTTIVIGTDIMEVRLGACRVTQEYKACLTGTELYDFGQKKEVSITFYSRKTDVDVTRTILTKNYFVGEEIEIEVQITNRGNAKEILFEDFFLPEIEIISASGGCYINKGVTVTMRATIGRGETKTCKYVLKALEDLDYYDLNAKVTFDDKVSYSNELHLVAKPALDMHIEWQNEDEEPLETKLLHVGDRVRFVINVTNNDDESLRVNYLNIEIPPSLKIVKQSNVFSIPSKNFEEWQSWEGMRSSSLKSNNSAVLSFEFIATQRGTSEIHIFLEFENQDIFQKITDFKESIKVDKPVVTIRLNENDLDELEELDTENIIVTVQKANTDLILYNISAFYTTELPEIEFGDPITIPLTSIPIMTTTDNYIILNYPYTAPELDRRSRTYDFDINVTYTTEYGQTLTENAKKNIGIGHVPDLSITNDINGKTFESGAEEQVEVKIENNRKKNLETKITIEDIWNVPVKILEGSKSNTLYVLLQDESITTYVYTFEAPYVNKKRIVGINTTVKYSDEYRNYTITKRSTITVNPKELKLSLSKKIPLRETTQGQIVPVNYRITNNEDEPIYDITLHFPITQEFDTLYPTTFYIPKLDPGEDIRLQGQEKIRTKINDSTIKTGKTLATYRDQYANWFNTTSNDLSFKVTEGYIAGASILLSKDAPTKAYAGEPFTYNIIVQNLGFSSIPFSLMDEDDQWRVFYLKPQETVRLPKTKIIETAGTHELEKAFVKYEYFETEFLSSSNIDTIEIVERAIEEAEQKKKLEKVVEEDKSIFERVWSWLYKKSTQQACY